MLDVHSSAHQERVLNWRDTFPHPHASLAGEDTAHVVELLRFADDIVVLRVRVSGAQDDVLLAVDIAQRTQEERGSRLLFQKAVPASSPVFVRHSRSYIWYGVFTADGGASGICSIFGVDVALSTEPIQFTVHCAEGGGLGESLCFEVYKDHLYTVSTLATSDNNERYFPAGREGDEEFSSFYQWSCYAPSDSGRNWSGRLWRREHREGPIHETWADLSIRMDETTGRLVIVECRREWPGGKSENRRTCYFQQLPSLEALDAQDMDDLASAWGDVWQFSSTINQIPYNERPSKRLRRNYHTEFEPGHVPTQQKEFILAQTKHRSYHLSASTFVDLVNDRDVPRSGVRTQDHLRLRVVSRKRKCPFDAEGVDGPAGFLFKPTQQNPDGIPVEHSEERFLSGEVHMWPPENAPSKLTRLLCPDIRIDGFNALADERSLIYSIQCPGLPIGQQILILISFDPKIHFSTMKPLDASQSPVLPEQIFPVQMPPSTSPDFSTIQESKPLYEAINWGYWLR